MSESIGVAMERFVGRLLAGDVVPITKRTTLDMAAEYIAKGWVEHDRKGRIVTLIWPFEEAPT